MPGVRHGTYRVRPRAYRRSFGQMAYVASVDWLLNARAEAHKLLGMHALLVRLHNPRGRECGCDADCWCRSTAVGRAVKWWFPGRYFGLHHKNAALEEWKRAHPDGAAADWKRLQGERDDGA
jgi:hypothetical protein